MYLCLTCYVGLELARQCGNLDRGRVLDARLPLYGDSQQKIVQLVALQGVLGDSQLLFGDSIVWDGKILVAHLEMCDMCNFALLVVVIVEVGGKRGGGWVGGGAGGAYYCLFLMPIYKTYNLQPLSY